MMIYITSINSFIHIQKKNDTLNLNLLQIKMLRNIVTGSMMLAAVPVTATPTKDDSTKEPKKLRPSELPIYSTVYDNDQKAAPVAAESESLVRSSIESGIKVVREACCSTVNSVKDKKKPVDEFVSTGVAHSQCK